MKIGLLCIATGKYNEFVDQFYRSAKEYFFPFEQTQVFLFTDRPRKDLDVVNIPIYHEPWPHSTLFRYSYFCHNYNLLINNTDYLFYADIDMRFCGYIGKEILPENEQRLVGTVHPGFWKGGGSWETRQYHRYILPDEKKRTYYAGGYQGGETKEYLFVADVLSTGIQDERLSCRTPLHNDETAWNYHLNIEEEHKIKTLTPAYCYPEPHPSHSWFDWQGEPKILALNKDHNYYRS